MFIPRIGMEVVVDFLDGDPDQPIVTGCVYNGVNKPPYALPGNATRSAIKTLSSKDGDGSNELRFEDKKDAEEVFLQAQKNLQLRTGSCRTESIGADSHLTIGKNFTETVGEDHRATVKKNAFVLVGEERHSYIIEDDYLVVAKDHHRCVSGNAFDSVAQDHNFTVDMSSVTNADMDIHLKAGMNIVLEAGMTLSLKAGSSSVVIGPAGVQITGSMVMINSGGCPLPAKKARNSQQADKPEDAKEAIDAALGAVTKANQQVQAKALRKAASAGQPFCAECDAARRALVAMGVL